MRYYLIWGPRESAIVALNFRNHKPDFLIRVDNYEEGTYDQYRSYPYGNTWYDDGDPKLPELLALVITGEARLIPAKDVVLKKTRGRT